LRLQKHFKIVIAVFTRLEKFLTDRRARGVLMAACLLPFMLGAWLVWALPQSPDVWYYKHWSRLVTRHGISAAYSGQPVVDFVDYPPVLLYPWRVEGEIYRCCVDPTFDEETMVENEWHTFGLASIAVIFHVATGLALYWLTKQRHTARTATAVATVYLLNPAALYNVAYLGLPDSAHSLWLVLAFGLGELASLRASWVFATLAALTKPQAWGLLPLFAWRRFFADGAKKTFGGIFVGVVTAAVVAAPFIFQGKLLTLVTLPLHMGDVQAVVSAQAHNLWWLVTTGDGLKMKDSAPLFGAVSYQHASLVLLAMSGFFTLWCARGASAARLLVLPAYQAFAWFCLTTRAHENHWFFVLPLLALALPGERKMFPVFVAVTATGFINLLLHDEHFGPQLIAHLTATVMQFLQLANCVVNVSLLVVWTAWLVRTQKVSGAAAS
jgi:hypothetical protein